MYSVLRFVANFAWYSALSIVVALAAYVALGRQFFPAISLYQDDIETFIQEQTSIRLNIDEIQGRWDGLNPVVEFISVSSVDDSGGAVGLNIGSLSIELAVIESFTSGQIKIDDLRVNGVRISASQDSQGAWRISGVPAISSAEPEADAAGSTIITAISTYLVQPYLEISDIDISLEAQTGEVYDWKIPKAQLVYKNDEISARGEIISPDTSELFARFAVEGRGRITSSEFEGTLFLEWQTGHFLNQYLEAYNWNGLEIAKLDASGKAWLDFSSGALESVFSSIKIPQIQLRTATQSLVPIHDASLDVHWQSGIKASKLTIADVDFEWRGLKWGGADYLLHQTSGSSWFRGTGANLNILTPMLLSSGLLDESLMTILSGYKPLGQLRNIELSQTFSPADEPSESAARFVLKANLQDVSVSAYDGSPSGAGVTGMIQANNAGGSVQFASDQFEMGFPELFLEGWTFRYAEGTVKWDVSGPVTEIFSDGLVLDYSGGGRVLGDFRLSLPETSYDRYLSLSIAPFDLPAISTTKFLPYHAVDAGLYHWLEKAVVAGVVTQGLYVGYGPVGEGDPDGLFESAMYFDVQDGEINFDDSWPNIIGYNGRVSVDPNLLNVSVDQGYLGKVAVAGASIQKSLFSKDEHDPVDAHPIAIHLNSRISGEDAAYAMSELPIKAYTAEVAEAISITGSMGLALDLELFLAEGVANNEKVVIRFPGVNIAVPDADLVLSKVRGELFYTTDRGIEGNLDVWAFGKPGKLIVKTYTEHETVSTRVLLSGSAEISALTSWLTLEKPYGLEGGIDYTALVEVSSDAVGSVAVLDVRSDLVGLSSTWPSLMGKTTDEPMFLRYRKLLNQTRERPAGFCYKPGVEVSDCFSLGTWLYGWRLATSDGQDAVTMSLNAADVLPRQEPGVWLMGRLDEFNLGDWSTFADQLKGRASIASPTKSKFSGAHLQIGSLNLFGQEYTDTQVAFEPSVRGKNLTFNGIGLAGNVWFPAAEGSAIDVDLKSLHLKSGAKIKPSEAETSQTDSKVEPSVEAALFVERAPPTLPTLSVREAVDLSGWRDIRLLVNDFRVDNMAFDSLQLNVDVNAADSMVTVFPIKLKVDDDVVEGHLTWMQDSPKSLVSRTMFSGVVTATDTADRWAKMGYTPSINSKLGTLDYSLTWPGTPLDYSLAQLSGKLALKLAQGNIREPNSSSNVLRLFGILNLDTLSRRLRLDFSDLTDRGISFDSLDALGSIQNGLLSLEEPLVIQGPSNVFKFTGKTDLVDEILDLNMVVILPLTQNLPLAALFIGAPAVGGGLWVIDKLLGDPLSKITSATYYVKGTWDAPEISLKSMFDNSPGPKVPVPKSSSLAPQPPLPLMPQSSPSSATKRAVREN